MMPAPEWANRINEELKEILGTNIQVTCTEKGIVNIKQGDLSVPKVERFVTVIMGGHLMIPKLTPKELLDLFENTHIFDPFSKYEMFTCSLELPTQEIDYAIEVNYPGYAVVAGAADVNKYIITYLLREL